MMQSLLCRFARTPSCTCTLSRSASLDIDGEHMAHDESLGRDDSAQFSSRGLNEGREMARDCKDDPSAGLNEL